VLPLRQRQASIRLTSVAWVYILLTGCTVYVHPSGWRRVRDTYVVIPAKRIILRLGYRVYKQFNIILRININYFLEHHFQLIFVLVMGCVLFAVRTECLNNIQTSLSWIRPSTHD
jgi:hypothetical protein